MAKSPIVLPLSTTFLQRFSQHFSTDGGRNPIGRRTEPDRTANGNGRGCSCLSCTNQVNWQSIAAVPTAPTKPTLLM